MLKYKYIPWETIIWYSTIATIIGLVVFGLYVAKTKIDSGELDYNKIEHAYNAEVKRVCIDNVEYLIFANRGGAAVSYDQKGNPKRC